MTALDTRPAASTTADAPEAGARTRHPLAGPWPLAGLVAAVSVFAFPMLGSTFIEEDTSRGGLGAVYEAVRDKGTATHLSMDLAFVGAVALALFGVGFLRFLAGRTPQGSGAAVLARLGVSSAVGLSVTVAVLKAVYRGGLPDHMDHTMYTPDAVAAFQPLLDQLQYTGLWPLTLTMAAVVVLALRHRTLPRWYGAFSAVVLVATLAMALVLGLPYFAGLVGPVWLVVSSIVVLRHRTRSL